ncbi:hypothetical protein PM082_012632 [Marasmius tenuissimus]|nr:hypothetical protein PM082_012632 [Marasmius tenuissimus]
MDLIFSQDDPKNATLSLTTGQPVYEMYTQEKTWSTEPTAIRKFQYPGHSPVNIGQVKVPLLHDNVCEVWGRDIRPKSGELSSGKSFISLTDGQEYTWKRKSSKATLTDKYENTIAIYEQSHSGYVKAKAPAKISIAPGGMPILDEIVVTCVYYEQKVRLNAEAAGAAGGVVGAVAG